MWAAGSCVALAKHKVSKETIGLTVTRQMQHQKGTLGAKPQRDRLEIKFSHLAVLVFKTLTPV